jgi:uncharacterized membrane protein YhaH (DUF805 family)
MIEGMHALRILFAPAGRLSSRPFIVAAIAIYLAGIASHLLTTPDVIARAGLWPFLAAQIVLIWIWYAVHAKRLRDAGHSAGLAAGVSLLYALSVALLVIVAASFYGALAGGGDNANAASALGLILFVSIIALLAGAPHYDVGWLIVVILSVLACLPIVAAVVTTLWAATRPGAPARST